jgi:uncharacterized membrane protein
MTPILAWLVGIPLLGALTGNRTMTPIAVVCWFAWAGHLGADQTWAFWAARPISAIIFTVLALGEFIGDKLPKTPNRTALFPLVGRIGFGGLCGALGATALTGSAIEGALLGGISAQAGTYLGYNLRKYLVKTAGWKDLYVALAEDVTTVALAVLAMGIITA